LRTVELVAVGQVGVAGCSVFFAFIIRQGRGQMVLGSGAEVVRGHTVVLTNAFKVIVEQVCRRI